MTESYSIVYDAIISFIHSSAGGHRLTPYLGCCEQYRNTRECVCVSATCWLWTFHVCTQEWNSWVHSQIVGLPACCDMFWYIVISSCFNLSFLKYQRVFLYPLSLTNFINKPWLNNFLLTQQPSEYFRYADSKQAEPQQSSPRMYLSFLLCLLLSLSAYPYPDLVTYNCHLALRSPRDFVSYP